ncbi:hypothetical protein [Acinetobacter chinensis]|uniref:hypothetical protein n=1 Tax=Acinetobacter chinensis TaxID=2004650 RepID=UPI00293502C4|nr:hypothetical protein [Acinetobacter chinensis]WOE42753.1 hypothetical protein QSG87_06415 [Acinetobacter chinensis]
MQPAMIPFHIREKLLQLEPGFEPGWQSVLESVFSEQDSAIQDMLNQQFLKTKEIVWDREDNSFSYSFTTALNILKHCVNNTELQLLADQLNQDLEAMKLSSDAMAVASCLEQGVAAIRQLQMKEDQSGWREKNLLLKTYLIQAAQIVHTMTIVPPTGQRELTEDQIRHFIVDVFLRYQLPVPSLKPQFKEIQELKKHPFFRYSLNRKQELKPVELIRSADYIFVIAPSTDIEQNPYSISRFLRETDRTKGMECCVLVLDLEKSLENDYMERFQSLLQTLPESVAKLSPKAFEQIQQMNEICEQTIFPLLTESVHLEEKSSDVFVQQHLKELENTLTEKLLIPLADQLKENIFSAEEAAVLYWNLNRLFTEMYAYYRVFCAQPALKSSQGIKAFEYKFVSLVRLLQKRRAQIFSVATASEWQNAHSESTGPVQGMIQIMNICLPEYRELKIRLNKLRRELSEARNSLFKRMIKSDQYEKDIQQISEEMQLLKRQIFTDIRRLLEATRHNMIHLETESMLSFTETARHFAFPCGENGLSRLPVVIKLPESFLDFDVEVFNAKFNYELNFSEGSKVEKEIQNQSDSIMS